MKAKIKQEVIEAIKTITVDGSNTSFHFQGDYWASESFTKQIQTKNYWMDLDFKVTVNFVDMQEYKFSDCDIEKFKVFDLLGNEIDCHITDDEIIFNININLE